MHPTFECQQRWWQTSQTRPSPRGIRQASTCCKWQLRPERQPRLERQTTQAHQSPKLKPAGNTSKRSSALPPHQMLMSTWKTSFQLSMESTGIGANFSIASSTRSTGFSKPMRSWTPTVKTPSPKISWGRKMGPGPPEITSLGGTSTQSPT